MAGVDREAAFDQSIQVLGGRPAGVPSRPTEAATGPLRWDGAGWTRRVDAPAPINVFDEPIPEQPISEGFWVESLSQLHPDSSGDMTLPVGGIVIDFVPEHPDAETGELHETLFAAACEVGRPQGRLDVRRVLMPWSDVAWAQPPNRTLIVQLLGTVDRIIARHRGRGDAHVAWLRTVQHLLAGMAER